MPYVKLDTCVLKSTIWAEPDHVRITWITMLLMANPDGRVDATAPGIAHDARLNLQQVRDALKVLESPDPDSRSQNDDGRRIERIDGGYQIINFLKYREKDHTAAARMRRYRDRKKTEQQGQGVTPNVTEVTRNVTQAEAEAEAVIHDTTVSCVGDNADAQPLNGTGQPPKIPPCPIQKIVALYHEILPELPKVAKITQARAGHIRARWKQGDLPTLDDWKWYFELVRESDFLMGRTDPKGRSKPWQADLEWLTKQGNSAKVVERKYH